MTSIFTTGRSVYLISTCCISRSVWRTAQRTRKYLKAFFMYLPCILRTVFISTNNAQHTYVIIISIQPLGRFWHEPELSQATGMALTRCILGKFLGVVCHCFPLIYIYIYYNHFYMFRYPCIIFRELKSFVHS
jgi:uncharacterized membrane protein